MSYLMESADEAARLAAQEVADPATARLRGAGLREGHAALDAGCGPGLIALAMADLVGPRGTVTGIDLSATRIHEAQRAAKGRDNLRFLEADVTRTGLPDASFDFVYSQYVFEYLRDPKAALAELIRVTRPGGRVCICDVDGASLHNWPMSKALEDGIHRMFAGVAPTGFDPYVGRKVFSMMRAANLADVRVEVHPFYVIAGAADDRTIKDWQIRFSTIEAQVAPSFGGVAAWRRFADEYLAMMSSPDALKYAVVVVTSGARR